MTASPSHKQLQIPQRFNTMRLIIIYAALGWRSAMSSPHAALRLLYIDHHGWLNTWLRNKLGNAADAADLAQDTFVRLLNRHELLELKAPRAFLRTVARGIVIDHWRREELERAYLEPSRIYPITSPLRLSLGNWFSSCWRALRKCLMV